MKPDIFQIFGTVCVGILCLYITCLLMSCTTPMHWSPTDHQEVMMTCRAVCGQVERYEPVTGECKCK